MADAQATARKVKRINKPFAKENPNPRRPQTKKPKVAGKNKQAQITKKAKEDIKSQTQNQNEEDLKKIPLKKFTKKS